MNLLNPTKGRLLIAEPSILNDKSFNRSVIFLAAHNKTEGTVGFIMNKPTSYTIQDLVPVVDCNFPIFDGGPVEKENLYFLHSVPKLIPNSIEIGKGIYWGGNFNILVDLLNNKKVNSSQIRFFLGYSGWDINQLGQELKESSWVVVENKYANIFTVDNSQIWKNHLLAMGGDYKIWANAPQNPSLN